MKIHVKRFSHQFSGYQVLNYDEIGSHQNFSFFFFFNIKFSSYELSFSFDELFIFDMQPTFKKTGNGMEINAIIDFINIYNIIYPISLKTDNYQYLLVMDISRSKLGKLPCFHKSRDNLRGIRN